MADTPDNQPTPDDAAPAEDVAGDQSANTPTPDELSEPNAEQVAEQSLDSAEKAAETIRRETADGDGDGDEPSAVDLPDFATPGVNGATEQSAALGMLNDIDLQVKVELGRTRMYIEDILKLNANSIVELNKAAGDPVDIYVNDRHVARGEVLVLSENFCVRVSEIIKQDDEDEPEQAA